MQLPLEITYRGLERNDYTDGLIEKKAGKLNRACSHIISCRVVLEKDQKQRRTGNEHRIRVAVRVPPGHELVVERKALVVNYHRDLLPLVRDAFEAAHRQVKDLAAQQQEKAKVAPQEPTPAFVDKLVPEEDHGYIRTLDGQEFLFHRHNVENADFDSLEVGAGVVFELAEGGDSVHASSVRIMR